MSAGKVSTIDPTKSVSKVISDVIHEFYISNNIKFDFIIYGEKTNHINDVIDDVTNKVNEKIPISLKHVSLTDMLDWNHEFNQSAVVFMKSRRNLFSFQEISKTMHLKYYGSKRIKFLVYIEEIEHVEHFLNVLMYTRRELINFVGQMYFFEFFIHLDRKMKEILLYAHQIFRSDVCGEFSLDTLNIMNVNSQKWNKTLKNFDHFENFNGCMLNFYGFNYFGFYLNDISDTINLDVNHFAGAIFEVIQIMSIQHNFTPQYTINIAIDSKVETLRTKNYEPNGRYIFTFSVSPANYSNALLYYTQSISTLNFMFHISYNDLYTNYEKLTMPFDDLTWILMLLTFGLTFATIFGLKISSQRIRRIIFGKGINIPAYNALGIFFGISQLRLPKESFPRSTLIIFIWFCLIIRTCWQSKIFEFMTSNMRKPLPASIEDLIQMNYTVIINSYKLDHYYDLLNDRESPKFINYSSSPLFVDLYKRALKGETKSKYAFFVSDFELENWKSFFNGSLPMLEYEKLSKPLVISSPLNNILQYQLNKLVDELIPSGILNHLVSYGEWYLNRPIDIKPEDTKRILSMSDLEFGFVIFLGTLSFPIFVFICEIHALYVRRQLRKLLGLYEFVRVIRERLKDYHDKW
ncbi:hypothetical protein PVAND_004031 [Polypedilum vanderplanki]|uniref:Ionotropic receptor n=1 Tax=Polypedilum vanderplanki TaxID=319348 RepID=A0A9J6BVT9_POLVA|nr:hypothetical protein PVAND_004031 [Polypedilum vanderplanki]